MDNSVTITLTSIGAPAGDPLTTRTIDLKHNQAVPVGRASKVEAKGYVAAANNAWFDSAVMSRKHAELSADLGEKHVTVTDPGSLHGTYVNDNRVEKDRPQVLQNGDTVVFGMSIYRRNEEFPPTRIRVNLQYPAEVPEQQPRVYCPPESVDASSDEDEDGGSVQAVEHKGRGYGGLKPLEQLAQSLEELARANAVDLTGDDEKDAQGQVVDLTDSPNALRPSTDSSHDLDLESMDSLESNLFSDVLSSDWGSDDAENDDDMEELSENSYGDSSDNGPDDDLEEKYDTYDSDEDDFMGDDHLSYDDNDEAPLPAEHICNILDEPDSDAEIPNDLDEFDATIVHARDMPNPLIGSSSVQESTGYQLCPIPALLNPTATTDSTSLTDMGSRSGGVDLVNPWAVNKLTVEENEAATAPNPLPDNKGKGKATDISMGLFRAGFEPDEDLRYFPPSPREAVESTDPAVADVFPVEQEKPAAATCVENQVPAARDDAGSHSAVPEVVVRTLLSNDLLEIGQRFLHSPPENLTSYGDHDTDDDAMISAATFQQHKLAKSKDSCSLKRKAEAISKEEVVVEPLTPTSEEQYVEMSAAVAEPPAKRPATDAAVAKTKVKGRGTAWAIVEKMGIAALGGAVVFGALVSSAPALP